MIKVRCNNQEYEVSKGKKVIDFLKEDMKIDANTILACRIDNEVKSQNMTLVMDNDIIKKMTNRTIKEMK